MRGRVHLIAEREFGEDYVINQPPATSMTCPVTKLALAEVRNRQASATSTGLPSRRSGVTSTTASFDARGAPATIGVSIRPGANALTVIPWGPSSPARCRVMPINAALVVL